ncbi:MAG: hypothetical protein ABI295_08000, partial [Xanthomarina sp.]
ESKGDGSRDIGFQIKEGDNTESFYRSIKRFGINVDSFGAKSLKACSLIVRLINNLIEVNNDIIINNLDEIVEESLELIEDEQYHNVLEKLELLNKNHHVNVYPYHYLRMEVFHGLGENLNALNEAHDYRRFLDRNNSEIDFRLTNLYSSAYYYNDDSLNTIKWLNKSLQLFSKLDGNNDIDVIEEIQSHLDRSYSNLKKEFVDLPFQKRKFIFMNDQLLHSDMEGLVVLKTNDAPENINFPLSHPQLNEVYTCHPINDRSYIPLKEYQKELFVDKLREFLLLLDVLGATKIDVINKNKNIDNNQNRSEKNIGVSANFKGVGADFDYKNQKNNDDQLERELNLAFHQRLSPKKAPYLPEGLVWFHTDLNWQRMAEQRMNGSLMSHKEIITSKKIESLSSHELTKVNVELNILFAKANVNYDKDDYSKSSSEHHFELEIQVEFEDIDNLKQVHSNNERTILDNSESTNNNANLDKYREDVLFMLEDDGIIDEVERKMLNRKIEKYGLTKEQAEKIEKGLMFNNDELKYIEEYKMLMIEGEIGELEKGMLQLYAKRYNINEDRQNIIESVINNKQI